MANAIMVETCKKHTMYIILYYIILCYVMLCYVMLCYVMLCYVMLCYVMLCYVMLCYIEYKRSIAVKRNSSTCYQCYMFRFN